MDFGLRRNDGRRQRQHPPFAYDKLDRMVQETRPLGQRNDYAYDAVGNLTQVTDPLGHVKKYTYDAANRRIKEDHYPSTGQAPAAAVKTIRYSYNTLDRLTECDQLT